MLDDQDNTQDDVSKQSMNTDIANMQMQIDAMNDQLKSLREAVEFGLKELPLRVREELMKDYGR